MTKIKVTFLGTSAAAPSRDRGLPGIVVEGMGETLLLDAGDGALRQAATLGIDLNATNAILLTHIHGDHMSGLLGILWSMSLADRTEPLTIVAPSSLAKWVDASCNLLRIGLGLTFTIEFVPAKRGLVLRLGSFDIRAEFGHHSTENFAYVAQENSGKGRRVGYSGDTQPSNRLCRFFHGCDLLICESTYQVADGDLAGQYKLSTSVEAATLARDARVKRLALTHFSPRYETTRAHVKEAREIFRNTLAARDGLSLLIE